MSGAPPPAAPAGHAAFWSRVEAELAAQPAAPEEEPIPLRSTDAADCYGVRLTGIGSYRLFAYLSIPRGPGPFPALYFVPKLQSVHEVMPQGDPQARRGRCVTLSLAFRGQRGADQPYAAAFPGLLTDGIDDPDRYVFRGIAADVLRGCDYLLSRPEVDRRRVGAVGANDLALLLAAMREGVTHLVTQVGPFHRWREAAAETDDYPIEEFNDYLRTRPEREPRLERTLAYFDPIHAAPRLKARTLLWAGPEGTALGSAALGPLAERIAGPAEVRATRRSHYHDGRAQEEWLAGQLGFEPIFPEAWREERDE